MEKDGSSKLERSAADINNSCWLIVAAIRESERPHEVLGAASFLPPLPFATAVSAGVLEKCSCVDERHRLAAIALEINSLVWSKKPEEVVTDVLSLQ